MTSEGACGRTVAASVSAADGGGACPEAWGRGIPALESSRSHTVLDVAWLVLYTADVDRGIEGKKMQDLDK